MMHLVSTLPASFIHTESELAYMTLGIGHFALHILSYPVSKVFFISLTNLGQGDSFNKQILDKWFIS